MERLLAFAVLALVLAGCAEPPAARDAGPTSGLGGVYEPPPDEAPPQLVDPGEDPPVGPSSTSPPSGSEGPSPGSGASTPTANPARPPAPAADAPPGRLPQLRIADRWLYRGVNSSGAAIEEVRTLTARGDHGGAPVYVLDVDVNGARQTLHITQAGLNTINATGFETELLRFPLAAGSNWTFTWRDDGTHTESNGSRELTWGWSHWLRGEVEVLALEKISVLSGRYDAFHVRATLTSGLGKFARNTVVMDYWYADEARGLVRFEATRDGSSLGWSELAKVELRA